MILAPPEYTDCRRAEMRYPEFETTPATLTVTGTKEPGRTDEEGSIATATTAGSRCASILSRLGACELVVRADAPG